MNWVDKDDWVIEDRNVVVMQLVMISNDMEMLNVLVNIHWLLNDLKVKMPLNVNVVSLKIFVVFEPKENVVVLLMIDYSTVLLIHLYFVHQTFVELQDS